MQPKKVINFKDYANNYKAFVFLLALFLQLLFLSLFSIEQSQYIELNYQSTELQFESSSYSPTKTRQKKDITKKRTKTTSAKIKRKIPVANPLRRNRVYNSVTGAKSINEINEDSQVKDLLAKGQANRNENQSHLNLDNLPRARDDIASSKLPTSSFSSASVDEEEDLLENSSANSRASQNIGNSGMKIDRYLITNIPFIIPSYLRGRELSGEVIIDFEVNDEGLVLNPTVIKSSGVPAQDNAVLSYIRQCRFNAVNKRINNSQGIYRYLFR